MGSKGCCVWCPRGTFKGENYHSFNAIPAVWEHSFGGKAYTALAAGIAGESLSSHLAGPHACRRIPLCGGNVAMSPPIASADLKGSTCAVTNNCRWQTRMHQTAQAHFTQHLVLGQGMVKSL